MINSYNMLILLLLITACEGRNTVPPVITYPANIPLPVSCVSQVPEEPIWDTTYIREHDSATQRLKAVLADRVTSKGYIEELKAVIAACE